jgi:hypothetical protein
LFESFPKNRWRRFLTDPDEELLVFASARNRLIAKWAPAKAVALSRNPTSHFCFVPTVIVNDNFAAQQVCERLDVL